MLSYKMIFPAALCVMLACSSEKQRVKEVATDVKDAMEAAAEVPTSQPAPTSQPGTAADKPAMVDAAWSMARAKSSEARLASTPAGQVIARAISAHGGLGQWYSNGALKFRFTYQPVDTTKTVRDSTQVIDTWSARARHQLPDDPTKEFGWDGSQAWSNAGEISMKPRFWSLTPFYFVGVPFVFADEGVNLEMAGDIVFEDRTYDLVKATFSEGTGDAPDDFYVVYVDRETSRVGGVRYIVSYPGFFPDGGHSPEKFMAYDGTQEVAGITFPKTFRTFKWDPEAKVHGELVTNSSMTAVSFDPTLMDSYFQVPEGATVLEGM